MPGSADLMSSRIFSTEPIFTVVGKRRSRSSAGMSARTSRHRNQTIGALLDRLPREAVVDDVVKGDAAPSVDGVVQLFARPERGYDDRHLPLRADLHVVLEAVIRPVNDLVDRKGRRGCVWNVAVMLRKRFGDFVQPLVELRRRARIQRREAADNPRLALGDDQLRIGDDEKRRADHR